MPSPEESPGSATAVELFRERDGSEGIHLKLPVQPEPVAELPAAGQPRRDEFAGPGGKHTFGLPQIAAIDNKPLVCQVSSPVIVNTGGRDNHVRGWRVRGHRGYRRAGKN